MQMELEDLCFAVLQPEQYSKLRHDLLVFWGCIPSEEQAAADRAAKAAAPPPPLPSKRMSFVRTLIPALSADVPCILWKRMFRPTRC